ncbi:MAG: hypothetical protein KAT06_07620 [Gammaproteobacteria bacterium]|nr:hypothetical protein [Gammaproteobacteria bacterium]
MDAGGRVKQGAVTEEQRDCGNLMANRTFHGIATRRFALLAMTDSFK